MKLPVSSMRLWVPPVDRVHWIQRRRASCKQCDPLSILFCGSDAFSSASLRALYKEHQEKPKLISSLDVVCRPPKRTGRGLKAIREVPIKRVAQDLDLPIHEIDTFTGWTPPRPIDLIVAVSFGLLVPPRILKRATYGGLNVHPSLLPDMVTRSPLTNACLMRAQPSSFRGAAPLHHTLLAGRRRTGVTLQTLHPDRFDHGQIVAQTPQTPQTPHGHMHGSSFTNSDSEGGVEIPYADTCTVRQLEDFLAPIGADMLVQAIEGGSFIPPLDDSLMHAQQEGGKRGHPSSPAPLAPKIKTEDRHVQWGSWDADQILRRQRVLGPLWSMASRANTDGPPNVMKGVGATSLRVVLHDLKEYLPLLSPSSQADAMSKSPGTPFVWYGSHASDGDTEPSLLVWTRDGRPLEVGKITVEGRPVVDAARAVLRARLVAETPPEMGRGTTDVLQVAPRPWH